MKSRSLRCPRKNEILLPYTLRYCERQGVLKDVTIIADSDVFKPIADSFGGIGEYYVEDREETWDELVSIHEYLKGRESVGEFLFLPSTQPLRSDNLIKDIKEVDLEEYDAATSYVVRANRDIYVIDGNGFKVKDTMRKGCMCKDEMVCDGAAYYMSRAFLDKVIASENPNKTLWNSKMAFVENHAPLVDIDTEEELRQFLKFYNPTS